MQCRSVLTRVDALRTGELKADEHGAVEEHLRTCSSCDASVHDVDDLFEIQVGAQTVALGSEGLAGLLGEPVNEDKTAS